MEVIRRWQESVQKEELCQMLRRCVYAWTNNLITVNTQINIIVLTWFAVI